MKYLRLFESFIIADKVINWKMIEDVKEMALEDIDDGLTLVIYIMAYGTFGDFYKSEIIYKYTYNHELDDLEYIPTMPELLSILTIKYVIILSKKYYNINSTLDNNDSIRTDELKDRVEEAYPKEIIR